MDQGEYYRSLGYQISGGGLQFYFVSMRTHQTTKVTEICLCGYVSWSDDLHDPNVTMQKIKKAKFYDTTRLGPYPKRSEAEKMAIELSLKTFQNPGKYGIFGVTGLQELTEGSFRPPKFF